MKIKIYLVLFIAVAAAFFLYAFSAIYPAGLLQVIPVLRAMRRIATIAMEGVQQLPQA